LKTTNVPLIGGCPTWNDDISIDRIAEFKLGLSEVQQELLSAAARGLIAPEDIKGWHARLFTAFVPIGYYAGNFRCDDAEMPCLKINVQVESVLGMHFQQVLIEISRLFHQARLQISDLELQWATILPRQRAIRLATVIANLVGGFIQIHPFINGNGRASRLLWRWGLYRFGVPLQCCVFPRPSPPYESIMSQAMRGDYKPLAFFVLAHLGQHPPVQI
jgi:fido (protein-threonine AMPylation protein)